jgi:hypothetical protein
MSSDKTHKYLVIVDRVSYASRTIEVEAVDAEGAMAKAQAVAGDYEYTEHSSEYIIDTAERTTVSARKPIHN